MFSDWIKSLEEKGLKLYQIGNIIDVTYQTVQSYRDKNVYPTVKNIIKLAEYFNISIDEMIYYPNKSKSSFTDKEHELIQNYNSLSDEQKGEINYHLKQLLAESEQSGKRDVG